MPSTRPIPRLYAVLDAQSALSRGVDLLGLAHVLREAGVTWVQYRDKLSDDTAVVRSAQAICDAFSHSGATLILNDRVHLVHESGFHGVHLGQGDLSPSTARQVLGGDAVLGLSTHTPDQALRAEEDAAVDYIAIGPVFPTTSKANPEASLDVAGVRAVRSITTKPLVAIGGISESTIGEVLAAGADSVAVIGALFGTRGDDKDAVRRLLSATLQSPTDG